MKKITRFFRLIYIGFILLRHGLDELVFDIKILKPLKFLSWFSPARWNNYSQKSKGERIRTALEELGPIFVKFGQLLSTRFDIMPEPIARELVRLQDQVPPFPGETAKKIVEKTLGIPIEVAFKHFDMQPLASASISQVHPATLQDGQHVVVKILRPNVKKIVTQDIELLKILAHFAEKYSTHARRFKPCEIVAEFEKALINELDLLREAANASQLRRNFSESPLLYVPRVYWEFTKKNILIVERVYGIPIANIKRLKEKKINLEKLAKRIIEIFFTQVFKDCFFHADMHPGNIFVSEENPDNPKCITVDFGIMGTLSPDDQHYLAENFMAFLKKDYRRVAELHVESGWLPKHTRIDEFESAIRTVCEPMFERPSKEISLGQLLLQLFQTASHYQINIQPQLILLQKTLITIEGLSRQLHPGINLWDTAKPFLETWMKNQVGIPSLMRKIKEYRPYWIEKLPELPHLVYATLSQLTQPRYTVPVPMSQEPPRSDSLVTGVFIGLFFSASLGMLWIYLRGYL